MGVPLGCTFEEGSDYLARKIAKLIRSVGCRYRRPKIEFAGSSYQEWGEQQVCQMADVFSPEIFVNAGHDAGEGI
jgi:hypothetical protein